MLFSPQRHFVSDEFYIPGGSVFLMIGGESATSKTWMSRSITWMENMAFFDNFCFLVLKLAFWGKSQKSSEAMPAYLFPLRATFGVLPIAYCKGRPVRPVPEGRPPCDGGESGTPISVVENKYPNLFAAAVGNSGMIQAKADLSDEYTFDRERYFCKWVNHFLRQLITHRVIQFELCLPQPHRWLQLRERNPGYNQLMVILSISKGS
ncbi:Hypothetical predicted protein [Lynx pardinus]|uniref:Uncharacterized protein n=1 Tax=Lynx pardinus TaxID=191816 RepID=A0A485MDE7_LYNPA|nr:Hypothetical predicted protein [Lynx pardinus]